MKQKKKGGKKGLLDLAKGQVCLWSSLLAPKSQQFMNHGDASGTVILSYFLVMREMGIQVQISDSIH